MRQAIHPILDFLMHDTVESVQTQNPEDLGQVPVLPLKSCGASSKSSTEADGPRARPTGSAMLHPVTLALVVVIELN